MPGSDLTAGAGAGAGREPGWLADRDSGEIWGESAWSQGRGAWCSMYRRPQVDTGWSSSVSLTDAGVGGRLAGRNTGVLGAGRPRGTSVLRAPG